MAGSTKVKQKITKTTPTKTKFIADGLTTKSTTKMKEENEKKKKCTTKNSSRISLFAHGSIFGRINHLRFLNSVSSYDKMCITRWSNRKRKENRIQFFNKKTTAKTIEACGRMQCVRRDKTINIACISFRMAKRDSLFFFSRLIFIDFSSFCFVCTRITCFHSKNGSNLTGFMIICTSHCHFKTNEKTEKNNNPNGMTSKIGCFHFPIKREILSLVEFNWTRFCVFFSEFDFASFTRKILFTLFFLSENVCKSLNEQTFNFVRFYRFRNHQNVHKKGKTKWKLSNGENDFLFQQAGKAFRHFMSAYTSDRLVGGRIDKTRLQLKMSARQFRLKQNGELCRVSWEFAPEIQPFNEFNVPFNGKMAKREQEENENKRNEISWSSSTLETVCVWELLRNGEWTKSVTENT